MRTLVTVLCASTLGAALAAQCPYYSNGTISAGLSRVGGGEDARLVYVDCVGSIALVHAKFGTATGTSMLNGLPLTIAVYDDPTNDLDPHDAVLVRQVSVPGGVTGANTGAWQTYDLVALSGTAVPATGGTWVAVAVTYPAGVSPGPGSIEFASYAPGTQWLCTDNGTSGLNYQSLASNPTLVDLQTGPGFPPGTWVIKIESGAEYRPFGSGCAGSNGTVTLSGDPTLLPVPGQPVNLMVQNLPVPATATALVLGLLQQTPPVDLGALAGVGAVGCMLHVQPLAFVSIASSGGAGGYAFLVPNNPSLVGLSVFAQVLALDSGANALGATSSNGLQVVVGF